MADLRSKQDVSVADELTGDLLQVDSDRDAHAKSKLWDGTNEVTVTGNKLDVNASLTWDDTNKVVIWDGTDTAGVSSKDGLKVLNVDKEHHEIHEGDAYMMGHEAELGLDEETNFVFTTPASPKLIHMTFQTAADNEFRVKIYEGASVTGGTTVTPTNRNFHVANSSALTSVKLNPTISSEGTLIWSEIMPTGKRAQGLTGRHELVLKQSTTYTFKLISDDSDNETFFMLDWYEENE